MPGDRVIAVVGATGRQGGAVAEHLLDEGWPVRALTRRPTHPRARRLAASGAEVRQMELGNSDSVRRALDGAYGVYSVQNPMTSSIEEEISHARRVADAARDTGVEHVVYGSAGVGVVATGVPSWESKLVVETYMREQALPVTVLRPMAFMELMTDRGFFPAASTWSLMPKLMGETRPVPWLCVDDLGAIAARVFADPKGFIGRELRLATDVQSIAQCRTIFRQVVGRSPRRFPLPPLVFERMVGEDLPLMWRWLGTHDFEMDVQTAAGLLSRATTVQQWLESRVATRPGRFSRRTAR